MLGSQHLPSSSLKLRNLKKVRQQFHYIEIRCLPNDRPYTLCVKENKRDLPSKNQRAAMASIVVTDLFATIGIESQDLIDELLEIGIIRSRRARKPFPTKHGV